MDNSILQQLHNNARILRISNQQEWDTLIQLRNMKKILSELWGIYINNSRDGFLMNCDILKDCSHCMEVEVVDVNSNITDLSPMEGMSLQCLWVSSPRVTLKGIDKIPSLCRLNLESNMLDLDLDLLNSQDYLAHLSLKAHSFQHLEVINNLRDLNVLTLSGNLTNTKFITHSFPSMDYINLSNNRLTDIEAFRYVLPSQLYLANNQISDISCMDEIFNNWVTHSVKNYCEQFNVLDLSNNPIAEKQKEHLRDLAADSFPKDVSSPQPVTLII